MLPLLEMRTYKRLVKMVIIIALHSKIRCIPSTRQIQLRLPPKDHQLTDITCLKVKTHFTTQPCSLQKQLNSHPHFVATVFVTLATQQSHNLSARILMRHEVFLCNHWKGLSELGDGEHRRASSNRVEQTTLQTVTSLMTSFHCRIVLIERIRFVNSMA